MSRKDYQALAFALASQRHYPGPAAPSEDFTKGYEYARVNVALAIAAVLQQDNPRFDSARFIAACKLA